MSWKDFIPDENVSSDLKDAFLAIYQAVSYDQGYSSAVSAAVAASIVKRAYDETGIQEKGMKDDLKKYSEKQLLWYAIQQVSAAQLSTDSPLWKSRKLKNALRALKKYIKRVAGSSPAFTPSTHIESTWETRYYAG